MFRLLVSSGDAGLAAGAAFGLLVSLLGTGAALFVLITIVGPVSGAHMDPAVSLAFAVRRGLPVGTAHPFVLAQVVGAIFGAMLAHLMFDRPALQGSPIVRHTPALWLSELVATAGLVRAILGGMAVKGPIPALVGAYIMAGYWFTASTSFANPAITLARTLTASAAVLQAEDLPAYVLAQLAGALLGLGLGTWHFARPSR